MILDFVDEWDDKVGIIIIIGSIPFSFLRFFDYKLLTLRSGDETAWASAGHPAVTKIMKIRGTGNSLIYSEARGLAPGTFTGKPSF